MLSMLRLAAGAVVILCAGAALAQPQSDFFPTKKAKWVYKVGDQEVTVEAVGEEMVEGQKCYKFVTKIGTQEKASELYCVKDDGVYRVKVKDDDVKPGVKILPIKIEKDANWPVDSKVGNQTVKGTFKVIATSEKVKVMGMEMDAVVVEGKDFDIAGTKTTVKQWFVKDKGMVKMSFSVQNAETTMELTKYEEVK